MHRRRSEPAPQAPAYAPGWQVPREFNFTRDVVEVLAQRADRRAATYVRTDGVVERRTFAEVARDAARWAHALRTRVDGGSRVLVQLGKVPAWHAAVLGALKGGLVTVPCSEMLRGRDLAFRVRDSGAALLVADRSAEPEIAVMLDHLEVPPLVLYLDEAEAELERYASTAPTEATVAEAPAFVLYTSGTTRHPKGVVHTHAYTWAKRAQAEHWLAAGPGDLVWCTAGTGWAKSIWNVLLGPWSTGAAVVVHEGGFDPEQRLQLASRLGVSILCQAPTEYRLIAKHDALAEARLPLLRHAVSAGEPLNPEVIEAFREHLGIVVHDGYGQTENTLLVANLPGAEVRPGSMGLPTPGHDVAVIDEHGERAAPGDEGELALRGHPPTLFAGYWGAPEATAAAFRGDWYLTGDRAVGDEDGYLWFTGRADDVILSAAYRIGPFEVESALLEHPAVAESAVVGKPDPERGEIVKAFVVLRDAGTAGTALAEELQAHVKSVTAPYKYPREIEFVTELPKTSSGKIRRVELRDRERALAAGQATEAPRDTSRARAGAAEPPVPVPDAAGAEPPPVLTPTRDEPEAHAETPEPPTHATDAAGGRGESTDVMAAPTRAPIPAPGPPPAAAVSATAPEPEAPPPPEPAPAAEGPAAPGGNGTAGHARPGAPDLPPPASVEGEPGSLAPASAAQPTVSSPEPPVPDEAAARIEPEAPPPATPAPAGRRRRGRVVVDEPVPDLVERLRRYGTGNLPRPRPPEES